VTKARRHWAHAFSHRKVAVVIIDPFAAAMAIVTVAVAVAAVGITANAFGFAFSVELTPVFPGQRVLIHGEVLFQGRRKNAQFL